MIKKHTFAILAYKESPYLQECIDSLKKQAPHSEIILCTSTPNFFLENVASNNDLQLFVNPERSGIVGDWNFALGQAATKYVTLAHQDDIYSPEYAREITAAAESRKDALIIFSDYCEIISDNSRTRIRKNSLNFFIKKMMLRLFFRNKSYMVKNKKRLLAFGNPIGCPAVTFHKNAIGSFKFDSDFSINMDWKAWYDLAQKAGSFVWVRKPLVTHRIYSESETSRGLAENRRQKEDMEMFKIIWPPFLAYLLAKIYGLSYKNNV